MSDSQIVHPLTGNFLPRRTIDLFEPAIVAVQASNFDVNSAPRMYVDGGAA